MPSAFRYWFSLLAILPCVAALAAPAKTCDFETGLDGWVTSSPAAVKLTHRLAAGPTGAALQAESTSGVLYVSPGWQFTDRDSCLSFDFCSLGPAEPYYIQVLVTTADGKEYGAMPSLRPKLNQWVHVDLPLARSFRQAVSGAQITRLWIGQKRAEGSEGRAHALLLDNVTLTDNVPQVQERDLFITASRLPAAPTIDGQLDDPAWKSVAPLGSFADFDARPCAQPVALRVGYDATRLYLAMQSTDDPAKLIARETQPDGPVWGDDSFEVFLDPDRSGTGYLQLAANPLGTPYSQRGTRDKNGTAKLDLSWEPKWQVRAVRTSTGWSAEMAVPFADLGRGPSGAWALQVGRNRPHGTSCSLFARQKDWCNPAEWGLLIFGEQPPGLTIASLQGQELRGTVTGAAQTTLRCSAVKRSGETTTTEQSVSTAPFVMPLKLAETGKQDLYVKLLAAGSPVSQCRYALPQTADVQVLRPQVLAATPRFLLWSLSPTYKVLPSDRIEPTAPRPVLELQAARNQTRALQIGLTPRQMPLRGLRLQFDELTSAQGKLSAQCLRLNNVGYVTIKTPSDQTTFAGDWPDPLLPPTPVDATGPAHVVFWLTVAVPRDAKPGVYQSKAHLLGEGVSEDFDLRLRVLKYELPDLSRLRVAADVWYGWGIYQTKYGNIPWEQFAQNAAAHRCASTGRFRIGEDGDIAAAGKRYFATGLRFAWFPVQFLGAGGWDGRRKWGDLDLDPDDPAFAASFQARIREIAEVFRREGWMDRTALWLWDEPFWAKDAVLRDKLPKLARLVRQAAPDLPIFISNSPLPELQGLVDLWCPALYFGAPDLSPGAVQAIHAAGGKLWAYHNELALIDLPAINARILPWVARKVGLDGLIWWSINYWGGTGGVNELDPWTEGLDGKPRRHGDGWMLYPTPNRDGILNSIRWELFREGLNDYDTLALLTEELAASQGNQQGGEWRRQAQAVLTAADAVVTSYSEFNTNAEELERIITQAESLLEAAPR
ncbi:MAG: glycoside hydrolase domain-containing protein [Armatimonadia bacterium]